MKLTTIDVYKMSNLAEWKLKAHINSFKHKGIVIHDILSKAEVLKREAVLNSNTSLAQKFEDLIETVTDMQKHLQTAYHE